MVHTHCSLTPYTHSFLKYKLKRATKLDVSELSKDDLDYFLEVCICLVFEI